jgi:hypothetical protein
MTREIMEENQTIRRNREMINIREAAVIEREENVNPYGHARNNSSSTYLFY